MINLQFTINNLKTFTAINILTKMLELKMERNVIVGGLEGDGKGHKFPTKTQIPVEPHLRLKISWGKHFHGIYLKMIIII